MALAGAALAAGGCGGDDDSPDAAARAAVEIDMRDVSFRPKNVAVEPGTTVRWTNRDTEILHTVTKVSGPGEGFDSGNVFPGQAYERRFEEPGRFDYVCTLHDGQFGSITVR